MYKIVISGCSRSTSTGNITLVMKDKYHSNELFATDLSLLGNKEIDYKPNHVKQNKRGKFKRSLRL